MRRTLRFVSVFGFLLAAGPGALPQGIIFPERPEIREQPFCVKSVRVTANVTDGLAETTVEQVFLNNSNIEQEGTYLFPLPEGASVTSFSLRAGDKVLEGRILSKEEARGIYESIVRRRRDPALLEYVGRGCFRSSVFPIPAHGERTLTLKYAEVLKSEGGLKRYSYSLSTTRFSSRPVELASVLIRLKSTAPLKTVYSPTHDVSVRRFDDHNATASWEGRGEFSDRDFTLYYATSADDVGLSLITYDPPGRDGYFMLIASPRFGVPREKILPKQIVFVLDRTGSMQPNGKMDQAKGALRFCLDNLHPQDRFNVITFNESTDILSKNMLPASQENVKRAQKFVLDVDASGGTNINEALTSALGMLREAEGTQKMVVFLTDGLPTIGETNVENILANVRRLNGTARLASAAAYVPEGALKARVFCFGVGYDVNVPFLDCLAEENHADADYVRPNESIESIVSAFYSKVSSPILAGLRLAFEGAEVYDLYPKELPDLFKGSQLLVAGRFRGNPSGTIRLTGYTQDHPASFTLANAFGERAASSGMIPRIWAARKIGYLLDQVRIHANQEVVDEIIRLSKEYGIITPYTSYLADERQDVVIREQLQRMPRSDALTFYTLRLGEEEVAARRDLNALGQRSRGESGVGETYRSLNSKEYQKAERAPAGAQGGFGGGGRGGGLGGFGYMDRDGRFIPRNEIGLDYLSVVHAYTLPGEQPGNQPGYKQVQANGRVQATAGKVFYRRGPIWFDKDYPDGRKVVRIQALSEAHFQLLRARPELNKYAAVGDEVVLDLGKNAVQIGKEGKEKLTESELKELSGK